MIRTLRALGLPLRTSGAAAGGRAAAAGADRRRHRRGAGRADRGGAAAGCLGLAGRALWRRGAGHAHAFARNGGRSALPWRLPAPRWPAPAALVAAGAAAAAGAGAAAGLGAGRASCGATRMALAGLALLLVAAAALLSARRRRWRRLRRARRAAAGGGAGAAVRRWRWRCGPAARWPAARWRAGSGPTPASSFPGLSLALMALMLALAANIGVGTMVGSFRADLHRLAGPAADRRALRAPPRTPNRRAAAGLACPPASTPVLPIWQRRDAVAGGAPVSVHGFVDDPAYRAHWPLLAALPQVWDRARRAAKARW